MGEWETPEQGAESSLKEMTSATLAHGDAHRPNFEMLVASPADGARRQQQVAELRRLRRSEDAFVYGAFPVGSFEDAVCAAILNPALAAVTIYEG